MQPCWFAAFHLCFWRLAFSEAAWAQIRFLTMRGSIGGSPGLLVAILSLALYACRLRGPAQCSVSLLVSCAVPVQPSFPAQHLQVVRCDAMRCAVILVYLQLSSACTSTYLSTGLLLLLLTLLLPQCTFAAAQTES